MAFKLGDRTKSTKPGEITEYTAWRDRVIRVRCWEQIGRIVEDLDEVARFSTVFRLLCGSSISEYATGGGNGEETTET